MPSQCFALFIGVQLVATVGCGRASHPVSLPGLSSIASATANLHGESLGHRDVIVELDMGEIQQLLRAIGPAEQCRALIVSEPIVSIELVLVDGRRQTIRIFDTGQNSLQFTLDDCCCVRSGVYERKNLLTGESTTFYPNEALNVYNYLLTLDKPG